MGEDFEQELNEIEAYTLQELQKELIKATDNIEKALKNKVINQVYNSYTQSFYIRTYQLRDDIYSKNNGTESIIIWEDNGEDSNKNPYDYSKFINQYSIFHDRFFIENAIDEINSEFGDIICEKVEL